MTGLKFKLAYKCADKETWSAKAPTQRKHLIKFLRDMADHLEKEPIHLEFEYEGKELDRPLIKFWKLKLPTGNFRIKPRRYCRN
jgi:hypothetical protein